ncbi:MAG: flagellar hook-basal body complex protein FliE [Lachnospiraceae bacterium]|nr:flagellar hook-basal body complex protein FliE [Lachnospiraceae bacterium]
MDITNILNIGSEPIREAAKNASTRVESTDESFTSLFNSMISNVSETNSLLHKEEEEEVKFALGISDNTHDLAIAAAKAQTALSYTVALRDKFIEAYKELMQIQV